MTLPHLISTAVARIHHDGRLLASRVEAASEKELLTVGLEERRLARRWS
jgi:hypothetical protein